MSLSRRTYALSKKLESDSHCLPLILPNGTEHGGIPLGDFVYADSEYSLGGVSRSWTRGSFLLRSTNVVRRLMRETGRTLSHTVRDHYVWMRSVELKVIFTAPMRAIQSNVPIYADTVREDFLGASTDEGGCMSLNQESPPS